VSLGYNADGTYDTEKGKTASQFAAYGVVSCNIGGAEFWVQDSGAYYQYLDLESTAVEDNQFGMASFTYTGMDGEQHVAINVNGFCILVFEYLDKIPLVQALVSNAEALPNGQ